MKCKMRSIRILLARAPSPAVPISRGRIAAARLDGYILFAKIRKGIEQLKLPSDVLLFRPGEKGSAWLLSGRRPQGFMS
jgi:hypothetical protein